MCIAADDQAGGRAGPVSMLAPRPQCTWGLGQRGGVNWWWPMIRGGWEVLGKTLKMDATLGCLVCR